jgi:predicted ATPase/class 3 adenylate cyclase
MHTNGLISGNISFLFTDIQGSTRLWENNRQMMLQAISYHDELIRHIIETFGGQIFRTVGDAFCAAFSQPEQALTAALAAQKALYNWNWQDVEPLKVRIALHTGEAIPSNGDYQGQTVNFINALVSAAHGGQILLSGATYQALNGYLPPDCHLRDLGTRRFKDIEETDRVFMLVSPELPDRFPPLKTLDKRQHNLPTALTSFVGRDQEVSAVCEILRQSDTRILTLTGTGGIGKTRLSLCVGLDMLDEFQDGVYWVGVSDIRNLDLVLPALAQSLGIKENEVQDLRKAVQDFLVVRQLLLIFDNFEQITKAAGLLEELSQIAANLKILVTSRQSLGIGSEQIYDVPPLAVPTENFTPGKVAQYASVRLFWERAQFAQPGFELNESNASLIAEICVALDGLPLALELAAAHIREYELVEILAQLQASLGRLNLLNQGPRDLPARQRTLRGAIEWSYNDLTEKDQALLQRLAVFAGGWTLEAAVEVVTDEILPNEEAIKAGLQQLQAKSLIRRMNSTRRSTQTGELGSQLPKERFAMLQIIREYALEQLEQTGQLMFFYQRHRHYFLTMVETAEAELKGAQQAEWVERLELERPNIRASLTSGLNENSNVTLEEVLRIGGALSRFWQIRGYLNEGRSWLQQALANERLDQLDLAVRAKAFNIVGILASMLNNYAEALHFWEQGLQLYRILEDMRGIANLLNNLGILAIQNNNLATAIKFLEEALTVSRKIDNRPAISNGLNNLGVLYLYEGKLEFAWNYLTESLQFQKEFGNQLGIAQNLTNLGWVRLLEEHYFQSYELFSRGLEIARELDNKTVIVNNLVAIAAAIGLDSEMERAAQLFGATDTFQKSLETSLSEVEERFVQPIIEKVKAQLGETAWDQAFEEGSRLTLDEALELAKI